ncbi:DNA mismatch repair protein MutL [Xylariaceae sp. AK1471]|nr:DNA mismatch repair protein MutL [Xylariaceae sp. AK1471]
MATIKPIEARTIHQIQSGQVIVDLCSVVKELVENSIDAGATNIEVRFKNQGLDAIEVQDNGSGISKENYDTLALKHYTSKLSTYSDLESLETFGFRGEALSSLCALSKFTVTTCLASDAPKGSRLEFETSGKLRSTSVVAAQKGTTVSVEGLFHNLPVRRRELERNIKREWNRVLSVLNQYACIQTGLKFSVSQQPNKGKRMVLFSTKGNQTTRENIVNVFGAKTLAVLIPLDLELELEPTNTSNQRLKTQGDSEAKVIRVRGHVSRPAYGEGRQTPDRQMFFVNGRPCGLPQFAKVFNEVYKSYNSSQSPFIFADIQLDTHLYDVNVSPDKRTILLHDQTRMLDNLRESLSALFESQDYALPTSQLQAPKQSLLRNPSLNRHDSPSSEASSKRLASPDVASHRKLPSADTQSRAEGENVDDTNNDEVEGHSTRNYSVSSNALAQAAHGSSLISCWIERKCDSREGAEAKGNRVVESVNEGNNDPAKDSQSSLSPHDKQDHSLPNADSTEVSNSVTNFRARLKELRDKKGDETTDESILSKSASSEPPIPALAAPTRITDIKSNKAYPSSLAKRAAPEVATITIGDHTVTSIIGSPSKKLRLDDQKVLHSSTQKGAKAPVPVPSFNGRLTQMFAAHTERSQADKRQIKVAAEMRDGSQHSDSSSENLFVDEEAEEESGHECATDVPSRGEDGAHASPQHSQASEPDPEEGSEAELTSPANYSDVDYRNDANQAAKEESDVNESIENAQVHENPISEDSQKRTQIFVKGSTKKKDATYHLQQILRVDEKLIGDALALQRGHISQALSSPTAMLETNQLDAEDAEEKLSLTISKSDFEKMKIIGQFNLGFILASRAAERSSMETLDRSDRDRDDELFIIDQHATDEKYNFERLQASTVVQSQRLVHSKTLELTAVEEDIVQENIDALERNGFMVSFDESGDQPVGTRCQLLSLPLSRETTFSLEDLEELISLLRDHPSASANTVPRPSKVRKMFAMRACRSSVMIGKSLTTKQMEKLVRHMGELDKPWNCPHGRPTMRHLCGLGAWDDLGWKEGDDFDGSRAPPVDWAAYLHGERDLK